MGMIALAFLFLIGAMLWLYWRTQGRSLLPTKIGLPYARAYREDIREELLGYAERNPEPSPQPKLSQPVWLAPDCAYQKHLKRQAWQKPFAWLGLLLGMCCAAYLTYRLHVRANGDWLPPTGLAIGYLLMLSGIGNAIWAWTKRPQVTALAAINDGVMVQQQNGKQHQYSETELRFDGKVLTTPKHAIKLTRRANVDERIRFNCNRMPTFEREGFIKYLLPVLGQSALSEPDHNTLQWGFGRGIFWLGFLLAYLTNLLTL